jgi:hypothetical protein
VVALLGQANEPQPERTDGEKPSEWLPAEWVESVLEAPSASAEVIEIQPGVRWAPPEPAPSVEMTAVVKAPARSLRLPGLRLPRIPRSAWVHRRHLQVAAAAAFVLATPVVIGALDHGLTGSARPAAQSPFHPAAIAAPAIGSPAGPRGPAPGLKPIALGGNSTGAAALVRAAPAGAASATPSGSSAAPSGAGASQTSSAPTPPAPGSGAGTPGSSSGAAGGGASSGGGGSHGSRGGGSSSSTSGPTGGGDSSQSPPPPHPQPQPSPVSQVQSVVSSAPQAVTGVVPKP